MVHKGKYASPMDPMGLFQWLVSKPHLEAMKKFGHVEGEQHNPILRGLTYDHHGS